MIGEPATLSIFYVYLLVPHVSSFLGRLRILMGISGATPATGSSRLVVDLADRNFFDSSRAESSADSRVGKKRGHSSAELEPSSPVKIRRSKRVRFQDFLPSYRLEKAVKRAIDRKERALEIMNSNRSLQLSVPTIPDVLITSKNSIGAPIPVAESSDDGRRSNLWRMIPSL